MFLSIRQHYLRLPIKSRLVMTIFSVTVGVFVAVSWVLLAISTDAIQQQAEEDLQVTIGVLNQDFVKVIILDSPSVAADVVSKLTAFPSVLSTVLYDKDGESQFGYHKKGVREIPVPSYQDTQTHFYENHVETFTSLVFEGREFGSVYVRFSLEQFRSRVNGVYQWLALAVPIVLVIALLLAFRLQRSFSAPVENLASAFRQVTKQNDFGLRVTTDDQSEIGCLYEGFNRMLETVQQFNENLEQTRERLHVTLESISDGVIACDDAGKIVYVNNNAERMLRCLRKNIEGLLINEVAKFVREFDNSEEVMPVHNALWEGRDVPVQTGLLLVTELGDLLPVSASAAPMLGSDGKVQGAVVVVRDETQRRDMEMKLAFQATHDSLTGLINRAEFESILQRELDNARESRDQHVLLYMDLDQFKVVNDTCGHLAGDQLLAQLSSLLSDKLRSSDHFARLGGDEFAVLLLSCDMVSAMAVAETIRSTVEEFRFAWGSNLFTVSISIGLVVTDFAMNSMTDLLSSADIACYAAKDGGRNRIHQYNIDDEEQQRRYGQSHWVGKIISGLENDRFRLYRQMIQPTTDNGDKNLGAHYEILVRMLDEEGQIVEPGSFLPAAERFGVISSIDRWVLRTTLGFLANDQSELAGLRMCSINLSGHTLADEYFLDFVDAQFERTGVPPDKICFEITETAAIANLSVARRFIDHLKGVGCQFALDDFGSGLSSFGYLKNLNVDYLKIDGMFVRDIVNDPIDRAMVKSINEVGQVMGMKTIAEFVENDAIRDQLCDLGVDYVQGYGIHKPEEISLSEPALVSVGKSG